MDNNADATESEIQCPFVNHSKATDQKAVSSLLQSPLSLHYKNRIHNGERIYVGKYSSVTSVLNQTKPPNEYFALLNWKKAQISELGKKQFKEKAKNTIRKGKLFHQVSM